MKHLPIGILGIFLYFSSFRLARFTLFSVVFLCAVETQANHILGGNIVLNPVSGEEYEVTLTLYTDCFGATDTPPTTNIFFFPESCPALAFSGSAQLQTETEVSDLTSLSIAESTCNGGLLPGVVKLIYTMSGDNAVVLDQTCSWTALWNGGDWFQFANIETDEQPTAYISTSIFPSVSLAGTAEVSQPDIPYMTVDQFEDYQFEISTSGVNDVEYTLSSTQVSDGPVTSAPASYIEPYSGEEPITAILLDLGAGTLSIVAPDVIGTYVITVEIKGYIDEETAFITYHTMAIVVLPCLPGTIDVGGPMVFAPGYTSEGGDTLFIEEGVEATISIQFTNPNGVMITSNLLDILPGSEEVVWGDVPWPFVWNGYLSLGPVSGTTLTLELEISGSGGCGDQVYMLEYILVFIDNTGCTDSSSCNYDELANIDDGGCLYLDECGDCGGNGIFGCTDPQACNWLPQATCGAETCVYSMAPDPEQISADDILNLLSEWGGIGSCGYDVNNDGVVNTLDLMILLTWM